MGNPLGKSLRESARDTRHGGTSREGESTHVLGTGCTTSGQAVGNGQAGLLTVDREVGK